MPALAERREDIPQLTAYFVRKHAAKMGKAVLGISRDAQRWLIQTTLDEAEGNIAMAPSA